MKRKAVKSCMGLMQTPFSVVLASLLNTLLFYFQMDFLDCISLSHSCTSTKSALLLL